MVQLSHDPILPSCAIVQAINQIIGRDIDSKSSAVVVVTAIHSGTTHNVIPDKCRMMGSVRDYSPEVAKKIVNRIQTIGESRRAERERERATSSRENSANRDN